MQMLPLGGRTQRSGSMKEGRIGEWVVKEKEERGKGNAQTAASQRKGSGNAVDPR